MKYRFILTVLFLSICFVQCNEKSEGEIKKALIIPQPLVVKQSEGYFIINSKTKIAPLPTLKSKGKQLKSLLKLATGFELEIIEPSVSNNIISLSLDENLKNLGEEGYKLLVNPGGIDIKATTEKGIFYGIQTLRQLLPIEIEESEIIEKNDFWKVPYMDITDSPFYKWRGLMLDCSRTFWNKAYIKRTIRLLSLYKMNVLHLHLTDDQGWRVAIDKYPELTQKGARFPKKWNEPKEREGFYSKEDIKEIVAYAVSHNITVVPEIEMPGHTLAVLACYPELSCTGEQFEIHPFFKGPGVHEEIFCAGNEKTFEFLENVLSEIFEMFPSEYIHIGGDEAPKVRWKACQKCQNRIKNEGLRDEHELQSWFIKRIEKFANSKGKKIIGWDEILEGGLSKSSTAMYWRGWMKDVPEKVISQGNNIIMSPTSHCYFDHKYKDISTIKAYNFNPVPEGVSEEQAKQILGIQANFWSHIDRTEQDVDKQLFPRLLSIAEISWSSKDNRDSIFFKKKVHNHLKRLDKLEVHYHQDSTIISKFN